jgi:adenylylsulfate kinase
METQSRSIVKAVTYRLLGSTTTGLIVLILTGKLALSLGASALDVVFKIGAYFVHERIWNHINYGRPKAPDYEI